MEVGANLIFLLLLLGIAFVLLMLVLPDDKPDQFDVFSENYKPHDRHDETPHELHEQIHEMSKSDH